MNTAVTITLPEWALWMVLLMCVLGIVQSGLKIYIQILRDRIAKLRVASLSPASANSKGGEVSR